MTANQLTSILAAALTPTTLAAVITELLDGAFTTPNEQAIAADLGHDLERQLVSLVGESESERMIG